MTMLSRAWLLLLPVAGMNREIGVAQAPTDSVVYSIHPSSRLVVKTGKAGFFGFAGHNHVIRAHRVSGHLVYYPTTPRSHLRIRVPTDSLEVLTPPDTAEIRKVTEAMRTKVLHPDKHPEMTFAAQSIDAKTGKVELQLAVTMEGVTRTIPVTAEVTVGSDSVRARGSFTARQTEFGIKPFSGGPGGIVKVADRVTFCFDLLAVPGDPSASVGGRPVEGEEATTVPGCVDRTRPRSETDRRPM
jgi:polyisoprenoid-binding protein YceI